MKKGIAITMSLLALLCSRGFAQTIKYVKPVATGTGDGSSWANASGNLKTIMDGAASNTQVWVAAGTYKPTTTSTRTISFVLKNGVAVYGGFAGTETLLSQRNWVKNTSILSGDIGVAGSAADNSYHVVSNNANNLDNTAILDGFTITAGNADVQGGGIYNYSSGPAFTNCIITGNKAPDGGGVANLDGKALYTNCSFVGNSATATGGAILNYKATGVAKFVNCSISGNQAATGGAVYNYLANAVFVNCISWGNSSEIANEASTVPSVSYCDVQGGYTGTGNISSDPKFITQPAVGLGNKGNLHLLSCSPAINVGNSGQNSTTVDLSGNARKNGTIDMGAYERPANAIAGIVFVDDNGPSDGGDGTSWANAFSSLQDALSATGCAGYTQIWVAAGTYKPTTGTDRAVAFVMKNNLGIYGGFSGTETLLAQRNANTNISILSGDIGTAGVVTDNSYHIIFNNANGLNATAVIDGFTISGGNANGASNGAGGGMLNINASPTVNNCIFSGNQALSNGGAMDNENNTCTVTNCRFIGNQAVNGGAVINGGSTPVFSNCFFSGNKATGGSGGGILNYDGTITVITNSVFSANQATSGGAFACFSGVPATFINCSFNANQANDGTFYSQAGGIITITNSIVRGTVPGNLSAAITYSTVQGGFAGTGNLDIDPQFADADGADNVLGTADDNLGLQTCSPAQDAGNDAANATTADLAGNPRKFNGKPGVNDIDQGAYEIQAVCCPPSNIFYVKENASGANNGSNWANAFNSLQDALAQSSLCGSVSQIWVAAGTYKPTNGTDRNVSFTMKNNLAIYGGFAGNETLLTQRNWNNNVTVLSGDIGVAGSNSDNTYHVISNIGNGLNSTAVLDGFTVTLGFTGGTDTKGAGVYNLGASPLIANCIFTDNFGNTGGGVCNSGSSAAFINCIFKGNAAQYGGAMENESSNIIASNCIFSGNVAQIWGGAIDNYLSSPTITNCSFSGNNAGVNGGAVFNFGASALPTITNTIIYGNNSSIGNANDGNAVVSYSIVQGGYAGTGNLDVNPQFVLQPPIGLGTTGDLRLQTCSPAQDAGSDAANATITDMAGNPRKFNGKAGLNDVDLGAYEIQAVCCPPANIFYVKENASGANNGSNWANAFNSLQDALAQSSLCGSVTQIWVAAGTYKPTTGADRNISFVMRNNLAIYGGFAGTETQLDQRNWNINISILSGDIGVGGVATDNSFHVIANDGNSLNATAVLDGLTITGGYAFGGLSGTSQSGGGMYNNAASPTVNNCRFINNLAINDASAIYNSGSSAAITNCSFNNNSSGQSTVCFIGVSTTSVSNCDFLGNNGAGLYVGGSSSAITITNSRFKGNNAKYNGGGILNSGSKVTITNSVFSGNKAGSSGGGIYNEGTLSAINCSFSGNVSPAGGAIVNTNNPSATITLTNSIVYGNSSEIANNGTGSSASVTYCIVKGGYEGVANLDMDPQFSSQPPIGLSTIGALSLQTCSPAQDAGIDSVNVLATDLAGSTRKFNGKAGANNIDMGAFEIQTVCCPATDTVFVNDDATGTNDGSSWTNAFTSLQDALEQANLCHAVTQVWVAAGTYKPTTGTDRGISFVMKNNLAIYGGFAGTETQISERNPDSNITTLSGDIGLSGTVSDNSYHVILNYQNGLNATAVLDGFIISAGYASNGISPLGGGMYNESSSPSISHCRFTGNLATTGGGGIGNVDAKPLIFNCSFSNNKSGTGGAIANNYSSPSITNCSFSGNSANQGGAIYDYKSVPTVTNCNFIGNYASNGCVMYNYNSPGILTNCSISGNQATSGSPVYNYGDGFTLIVRNCIFYGNATGNITNQAPASAAVTYSIVQGGYPGTGNLDVDPQFVLRPPVGPGTSGDLRLQPCSPAINMGNDADNNTTLDLDSNNRKFGVIDMGAYERQSAKPTTWYLDVNATGTGDGTSWKNAFTNLPIAVGHLKGCNSSDSLLVAAGGYNTPAPIELDKLDVVILGGYPTGGGTRNPAANPVSFHTIVNVRKSLRIDGVRVGN